MNPTQQQLLEWSNKIQGFRQEIVIDHLMSEDEKKDIASLQQLNESKPEVVVPFSPVIPLEDAIYQYHIQQV